MAAAIHDAMAGGQQSMHDLSPDNLDTLTPEEHVIALAAGGAISIGPVRVRNLASFVRALGPAREALAAPDADVWDLIADFSPQLVAAVAVLADVPESEVEDMEPGEFMSAIGAMLEANQDFFVEWLSPIQVAAMTKRKETGADGQTSSSH
jgi:hypothetical protein